MNDAAADLPVNKTLSAAWVLNTLGVLEKAGLDVDELATTVGIVLEELRDPSSRWHTDIVSHLWSAASERVGPSLLAKINDAEYKPAHYGILSYIMLSSPNLLVATRHLIDYLSLISNASVLRLRESEHCYTLETEFIGGSRPVPRQRYEYSLIAFIKLLRWACGDTLTPIAVTSHFDPPEYLDDFRSITQCPIEFNASVDSVSFSRETFDLRPCLAMTEALDIHLKIAHKMQRGVYVGHFQTAVKNAVKTSIELRDVARKSTAARLCMSERTFTRKLDINNLSYRGILDRVRCEMALCYLANSRMPIGEIADKLAYSNLSVFTRAFNRSTGKAPSEYRT